MRAAEMQEVIAELRSFYGENGYAPRMLTMVSAIMMPLTRTEASQLVESLAMQFTKAPSPAQIKVAALPLLQRAWEREKREAIDRLTDGEPCAYCSSTGVIFALSRSDPTLEYSFGCTWCPAYRVRKLRHPEPWADSLRDKFVPVSQKADSYIAASRLREAAFDAWIEKAGRKVTRPAAVETKSVAEALAQLVKQTSF